MTQTTGLGCCYLKKICPKASQIIGLSSDNKSPQAGAAHGDVLICSQGSVGEYQSHNLKHLCVGYLVTMDDATLKALFRPTVDPKY